MSLVAKAIGFAKTTNGAPTTQAVTGVGLGKRAKAGILWTVGGLTSGTFAAGIKGSIGFWAADQLGMAGGFGSDDAAATSNTRGRRDQARCVAVMDGGVVLAVGSLLSIDGDDGNHTFTWHLNDANAYLFQELVFGGDELEAFGFTIVLPAGTGSVTYRDIWPFKPDFGIHVRPISGESSLTASPWATSWGVFDRDLSQGCVGEHAVDAAATSDTQRLMFQDAVLGMVSTTPGTDAKVSITALTGDGMILNRSTNTLSSTRLIGIVMRGLKARVFFFVKSVTTPPTTQGIVPSPTFDAKALLLLSHQSVTVGSGVVHARLMLGCASGAGVEQAAAATDTDALADTSVDAVQKTDKVLLKVDNNTQTIDSEATVQSFDAGGQITLSYPATNDAVATAYIGVSFGDPAPESGSVIPADMDMAVGQDGEGAHQADGYLSNISLLRSVLEDEELADLP